MSRVLLINPPWTFYPGTNRRMGGPSYTLAAVAAEYRRRGYEVRVLDCCASNELTSDEDTVRVGLHQGWVTRAVRRQMPDLIGISCTWTVQFLNAVDVLDGCRKASKTIPVVAGGHDPTVRPEAYREVGFDDISRGEIEQYESLDDLPLPAWDLLPMAWYRHAARHHHGSLLAGGVPVVTSRGCPHSCNFCTVHLSMGRKWRGMSPERVIELLSYLESMGFTRFHFEDDNLTFDRNRWRRVMELMVGRGWEWDTPNGVRLDHLDDEYIGLAARAGCVEFRVAPESARQTTVDAIGKRLDVSLLARVAESCSRHGVRLSAFWVVGIPGETLSDIRHTFDEAARYEREMGVVPRISIATPFPGTDLLAECKEKGWLAGEMTPRRLAAATHLLGLIRTPEFTPEDIACIYSEWTNRDTKGSDNMGKGASAGANAPAKGYPDYPKPPYSIPAPPESPTMNAGGFRKNQSGKVTSNKGGAYGG